MSCGCGQDEWEPAVRIGDAPDPGRCIRDHRIVERTDFGQHLQRMERRGRLALGGTHVGLQGMAEAAGGVAVGAQRLEDRRMRRAVEEHRQAVAVEQAGVGKDELLGSIDVDRHPATLRRGQHGVFQESDRRGTGQTTYLIVHMRLAHVARFERSRYQRLVRERNEASQASDPGKHLGPISDGSEHPSVELALTNPERRRDARDTRLRNGEPPRRGEHKRIRLGAPLRHRVGEQLQSPRRLRAGHGLLESRSLLAPDECESDLPITHLRCRQTQDGASRTGAQPDPRHAASCREIHASRPRIGAGDHQLALSQPDQIDATIRHDPLRAILGWRVLPHTRHDRLQANRRPILAISEKHRLEGTAARRLCGLRRLWGRSGRRSRSC